MTQISFFVHQDFGAWRYARPCAKISAQSVCYAGHVNGNMDFFPVRILDYQSAPLAVMSYRNLISVKIMYQSFSSSQVTQKGKF